MDSRERPIQSATCDDGQLRRSPDWVLIDERTHTSDTGTDEIAPGAS